MIGGRDLSGLDVKQRQLDHMTEESEALFVVVGGSAAGSENYIDDLLFWNWGYLNKSKVEKCPFQRF